VESAPTSARGRIIIRCTVGLPLGERDLRVPIRRSALLGQARGVTSGGVRRIVLHRDGRQWRLSHLPDAANCSPPL
jgi:hypothetical protein